MRKIALFVEDFGHEEFITHFINKINMLYNYDIVVVPRSATRGHGHAASEFERFLVDVEKSREQTPDLLIVALDTNCHGINKKRNLVNCIVQKHPQFSQIVIFATPDPHVERWLLLDSSAFKKVFGAGCKAPDKKCNKARYKDLLSSQIKQAGFDVFLGGFEYAEDLIREMTLDNARRDASLNLLLEDLVSVFNSWSL